MYLTIDPENLGMYGVLHGNEPLGLSTVEEPASGLEEKASINHKSDLCTLKSVDRNNFGILLRACWKT
jgi:hypothetical protein